MQAARWDHKANQNKRMQVAHYLRSSRLPKNTEKYRQETPVVIGSASSLTLFSDILEGGEDQVSKPEKKHMEKGKRKKKKKKKGARWFGHIAVVVCLPLEKEISSPFCHVRSNTLRYDLHT